MSTKLILPVSLAALLLVGACGQIQIPRPGFLDRSSQRDTPPPPGEAVEVEELAPLEGEETLDSETAEPEAIVLGAGELGETVASLGDPTVAGLWLETGLVAVETAGRLTASNGRWVNVTLIPSGGDPGAGSRISVGAMQALGLSLTDLATITVSVAG